MSQSVTTTAPKEDRSIEYIPFGSDTKIKLSIAIVKNTVAIPTKQGKLPNDAQILRFIMMCQAQRLNPYAGDAYLVGYDGPDGPVFSLITAHQAILKRAEVSEDFAGMESGLIIKDEEGKISEIQGDFYLQGQAVLGGWAKVYHKKRKDFPFYRRIRMERFNTGRAQWKVDAAGMICKCAEADALRSAFPTMLGGLYMAEDKTLPVDISSTVSDVGADALAGGNMRQLPPTEQRAEDLNSDSQAANQKSSKTAPADARSEMQSLLDENGLTERHLRVWAADSGNFDGLDTFSMLSEIPSNHALVADMSRILKVGKAALVADLKKTAASMVR
jgi:phage recombination protein Bet